MDLYLECGLGKISLFLVTSDFSVIKKHVGRINK